MPPENLPEEEADDSDAVHEMVHLLAPTHNAQFVALMDRFMPQWRLRRDQLNRLPVRHEEWAY
jgi:predicted metal-dependent hydrolase